MESFSANMPIIDKFAIYEPRCELNNKRSFITVKGGQSVTYYQYPATSYNLSGFEFNTIPPGKQNILDRIAIIDVPTTFTFTPLAVVPGQLVLQNGFDALRAYPLSSVTQSIRSKVNGYDISIEIKDIVHALSRFHTPLEYNSTYGSIFPNYLDNYQNYSDGVLANNNPLGPYIDSSSKELMRGSYTITSLTNTDTTAVLNVIIREYIILPPYLWDGREAGGLTNLDTLSHTWNLAPNLARMWSRASNHPVALNPVGGINIAFGQPTLLLTWITPRLTQPVPRLMTYPFFQVSKYIQQNALVSTPTLAPNASGEMKSNLIQFDSVPRKIYLFPKQSENVINSTLNNTVQTTDTFLRINSLSISWDNINGIFSGATPEHLWQLSSQNGMKIPWPEWYGTTTRFGTVTGTTSTVGLVGGIVCICPGKDFGLRDTLSEGSLCKINFQATLNVTNINQTVTLQPDFYIIAVFDGILEIFDNSARTYIGILNENEVLNLPVRHDISYNALDKIYGGDFFTKFRDFLGNVGQTIKDKQLISKALGAIPHPLAQVGATVANAFGLGYGKAGRGGVRAGMHAGVLHGGCEECEGCGCPSGECMCLAERFGMQIPEELPSGPSGGRMTNRDEMKRRLRNAKY